MAADPAGNEWAQWGHHHPLGADVIQGGLGQPGAQSPPLETRLDPGVGKDDAVLAPRVLGPPCELGVGINLVAVSFLVVEDVGVCGRDARNVTAPLAVGNGRSPARSVAP